MRRFMPWRRVKPWAGLVSALLLCCVASPTQAHAAPPSGAMRPPGVRTTLLVHFRHGSEGFTSTLALTLPAVPLTHTGPGGSGTPAPLPCNKRETWSDSDGTVGLRNNCPSSVINWDYTLSPALQAIIDSTVAEPGMLWWLNGAARPRLAPHPAEPKGYLFHGTLNPVHVHDEAIYHDEFDFSVDVGGAHGTGQVLIDGDVRAVTS
jgi:hypothetical protein